MRSKLRECGEKRNELLQKLLQIPHPTVKRPTKLSLTPSKKVKSPTTQQLLPFHQLRVPQIKMPSTQQALAVHPQLPSTAAGVQHLQDQLVAHALVEPLRGQVLGAHQEDHLKGGAARLRGGGPVTGPRHWELGG